MAYITATDTFDEELLEPEDADKLEPLITWLNENMQNIVGALQGNIGDVNLATKTISVKATSGVRQSVNVNGIVSHVTASRVQSQADSNVMITGFNWWPTAGGFEFLCEWSGQATRELYLRIEINV